MVIRYCLLFLVFLPQLERQVFVMLIGIWPENPNFIIKGEMDWHLKIETYSILVLALIRLSEPVIMKSIKESLKDTINWIACKKIYQIR